MSRTVDGETEILLGNKHLLGIFFLLAVLIGASFVAGYMLGRGSFDKRSAADQVAGNVSTPPVAGSQPKTINPSGEEAPSAPAPAVSTQPTPENVEEPPAKAERAAKTAQPNSDGDGTRETNPPVDKKSSAKTSSAKSDALPSIDDAPAKRPLNELYTPEPGQRFLQVAATNRESAEAVADVLTKAGFPAHVTPKPGDEKFFRVLVGPIKDNNDLTAKREALMKKGFTGMIPRTF